MNKLFKYDQNNSGGVTIRDANLGIDEIIIVEAKDAESASLILDKIEKSYDDKNGIGSFRDYCECCGYRWYEPKEIKALPNKPLYKTFVHYLDGTIKEVK